MAAITGEWEKALLPEFKKPYYRELYKKIREEYSTHANEFQPRKHF